MIRYVKMLALVAVLGIVSVVTAQDAPPAQTPTELCAAAVPAAEPATRTFTQAETVLEAGVDYRAIFCTGAGPVYIDLWEDQAPQTVNNFIFLAQNGYYNATHFHRVIADFMVQGGDPTNTGTGGPGYQFDDEFVGFLTFDRPGLLAMANAGAGTNGSQFFITTAVTDWLNYKHTIFGDVLEGYENVTNIELRDPQAATSDGTTLDTVLIITDPATVKTTFAEEVSIATAEEFYTQLSQLTAPESLPTELVAPADVNGIFTAEQIVEGVDAAISETYASLLADHNFQYRARVGIVNQACAADYFFTAVGYSVDSFASAEDAAAFLADERLDEINAAANYTRGDSALVFYSQETADCAQQPGVAGKIYLQRGRYVAIVEGIFTASIQEQIALDLLMSTPVTQLFEQLLSAPYRSEIR